VDRALADPQDSQESTTAPDVPAPFGRVERFEVSWTHQLSPADLVQLVASRSYVITLPEQERRGLLAEVADFVATDPALADREQVGFPYITVCTRAQVP
jgi:hypothetical protein